MKMTNHCLVGCVLSLGLAAAGCATAVPQLAGSEWRPTEIGGIEVPAGTELFVRFGGEGRLEGHGGCNGFFGSYELEGDRIETGPLGATRMACSEPVMETEFRFMSALEKAERVERDRIDLTLLDGSGSPLARLIQTDAD